MKIKIVYAFDAILFISSVAAFADHDGSRWHLHRHYFSFSDRWCDAWTTVFKDPLVNGGKLSEGGIEAWACHMQDFLYR